MFPVVGKRGNIGRKHNVSATMFPCLPRALHLKYSQPFKIVSFFRGSILASLDTFKKMWVSKKEWEEENTRVLHRKTF